jgi:hypothetical protein
VNNASSSDDGLGDTPTNKKGKGSRETSKLASRNTSKVVSRNISINFEDEEADLIVKDEV